jgi:uncharacterized lipoprotein
MRTMTKLIALAAVLFAVSACETEPDDGRKFCDVVRNSYDDAPLVAPAADQADVDGDGYLTVCIANELYTWGP